MIFPRYMISTNHKIVVSESGEQIKNRIFCIKINGISEEDKDETLPGRLRDQKRSCREIITALGFHALRRETITYTPNKVAKEVTNSIFENPITDLISATHMGFFKSEDIQKYPWMKKEDVYNAYKGVCEENGNKPCNKRNFLDRLEQELKSPETIAGNTTYQKVVEKGGDKTSNFVLVYVHERGLEEFDRLVQLGKNKKYKEESKVSSNGVASINFLENS